MKNQHTHQTLQKQQEQLLKITLKNPNLRKILNNLKFPHNHPWYIAAGCVNQTVWNHLTNRKITHGIGDYDIVYWDDDISKEAELRIQREIKDQFPDLAENLDIVNEARVHLWFEEDFGQKIEQYKSLEHAISTWPTTITCIGITKRNGEFSVVAPYGLSDLFGMILRPNLPHVIPEIFEKKVEKWTAKWLELRVIRNF
ncbi:hypothetical protein GF360_02835 [candidate division WWE3 bacterium]|nr:hypothetical protein [candidate division WWE3 bacterium]